MTNQTLFSSKDKSKKLKCRLLQFLLGALRVNVFCYGLLRLHGKLLVLPILIFTDAMCYFRNASASLKLFWALTDSSI